MTVREDFEFQEGETFIRIIRWETPPFIYKAITGIARAAPAVVTAPLHGLKSGWRAAVIGVQGMTEINARHTPPRLSEFLQVIYVDDNSVELNTIDSSQYTAYTSGGYLKYYTPASLAGYSARMKIKDRVDGNLLATLTSGAPDNRIAIDDANHTITLTVPADDTAGFTFTKGVYDLELVSGAGVVTRLYSGGIKVSKEVTTT